MKSMSRMGPAPLADEEIFIPQSLEQAIALEAGLVRNGTQRAMAGTIVMWLTRKGQEGTDDLLSPQRARYRRELARLGSPPWDRQPNEYKGAYLTQIGKKRAAKRGRNSGLGLWRRPVETLVAA